MQALALGMGWRGSERYRLVTTIMGGIMLQAVTSGLIQMIVLVNCFEVRTVARASLFFVAAETFAILRRSLRCIDERSMRDYRP